MNSHRPATGGKSIPKRRKPTRAFSLIEVMLALGVLSFALISVMALWPAGLKSVKAARDEAAAANVMQMIAGTLRTTALDASSEYKTVFAGKPINFKAGDPMLEVVWNDLTLEGYAEKSGQPKQLVAVLNLYPPADRMAAGRAMISVAWSAQSRPVWDPSSRRWSTPKGSIEGSITRGIQFIPRP